MTIARTSVRVKDTVICMIDEWREGKKSSFDCNVLSIQPEDGITVTYFSGYRSRHDFVPWADVLAKVDKRRRRVDIADFRGHFLVFDKEE